MMDIYDIVETLKDEGFVFGYDIESAIYESIQFVNHNLKDERKSIEAILDRFREVKRIQKNKDPKRRNYTITEFDLQLCDELEENYNENIKNIEEKIEGILLPESPCKKCGNIEYFQVKKQTRSADEPEDVTNTCTSCFLKWKE